MLRWIDWKFIWIAAAVYVAAEAAVLVRARSKKMRLRPWREVGKFVLCLYAAALMPMLVWPQFSMETFARRSYLSYNLMPFGSIAKYFDMLANNEININTVVVNLIGNIILFVPLGLLVPALWTRFRRFWTCLGLGALVSLGVELAQLLFSVAGMLNRCADIDDMILNTAGTAVGYAVYSFTRSVWARSIGRACAGRQPSPRES